MKIGNRNRWVADTAGMCLTEILVGLTAGAIVLAATLDMVVVVKTRAERQFRVGAEQQDVRLALEVFEQEVRQTTPGWIISATAQEIVFHANVNGLETVTTSAVLSGQTTVSVLDGGGWGEGKLVSLCGPQQCERHRLARTGTQNELILAEPITGSMPAGSSVEVINLVRYYTRRDEEEGGVKLMRMVDGGASTLVGPLQDMRVAYWDEHGRTTSSLRDIKRITIHLQTTETAAAVVRDVALRS